MLANTSGKWERVALPSSQIAQNGIDWMHIELLTVCLILNHDTRPADSAVEDREKQGTKAHLWRLILACVGQARSGSVIRQHDRAAVW